MFGEFLLTLFMLGMAVFLFIMATKFPTLRAYDKLGPAFWPKIILIGLIALNGIRLTRFFLTQSQDLRTNLTKIALDSSQKRDLLRLLSVITLCLIYTLLMPVFGFLLLTPIFQVLLLLTMGTKKWTTLVITPIVLTGVLFGIFVRILHIPLPRGIGVFNDLSRMFY